MTNPTDGNGTLVNLWRRDVSCPDVVDAVNVKSGYVTRPNGTYAVTFHPDHFWDTWDAAGFGYVATVQDLFGVSNGSQGDNVPWVSIIIRA